MTAEIKVKFCWMGYTTIYHCAWWDVVTFTTLKFKNRKEVAERWILRAENVVLAKIFETNSVSALYKIKILSGCILVIVA